MSDDDMIRRGILSDHFAEWGFGGARFHEAIAALPAVDPAPMIAAARAAWLEEAADSLLEASVWCDSQERTTPEWHNGVSDARKHHRSRIRALITADEADALAAHTKAAVDRAVAARLEEAAGLVSQYAGERRYMLSRDVEPFLAERRAAIRALITADEADALAAHTKAAVDRAVAARLVVRPLAWAHQVEMPSGNLEVRTQEDGRVEFFTHCGLYTIRDRGTPEAPMFVLRRLAAPLMGSAKLSELYEAAQKDYEARTLAALITADDADALAEVKRQARVEGMREAMVMLTEAAMHGGEDSQCLLDSADAIDALIAREGGANG